LSKRPHPHPSRQNSSWSDSASSLITLKKRYILGYVIVSTAYADDKKTYPINFQFRLSTDKDQQERQIKAIKKKHHIDLRKKGALLQFIDQCDQNDVHPHLIDVAGHHLEPNSLNAIDIKNIPWIGIPNAKTPLLNHNNTRGNIEELKLRPSADGRIKNFSNDDSSKVL
jgi:hypothetical protein